MIPISMQAPRPLHMASKHSRMVEPILGAYRAALPSRRFAPLLTEDSITWHGCSPTRPSIRPPPWPSRPRAETLAYVALPTQGENGKKDALGVIDADPDSPRLRPARAQGRASARRQRAAPLRLECLQLAPLRLRGQPARRASLPRPARHQQLAHPHSRHSSRSARPAADQGDRGRRGDEEDRLRRRRTPCTAAPTASTSTRSARPTATVRAASSCSTTTPSR